MGSHTISLQESVYRKLRAAKRPGESFSELVIRLLGENEPSLLDFQGLLDGKAVEAVRQTIMRMKEEDVRNLKRNLARGR